MTPPRGRSLHGPASPRGAASRGAASPRGTASRAGRASRHKVLITLLAALVLVLAIGATARTLGAGHPAGRGAGHPVTAPELPAATRGAKWVTGPAGKLLQAVNADLGRLGSGERAGRPGLAQRAGSRLAAASRAALSGPMPPADAKIYRSALKGFERVGIYITHGKFRKADILLNRGDSDIAKVTSAANRPAKMSRRNAVKEPNGQ